MIAPAYNLHVDESEIVNARPSLISAIAAQFYFGAFMWLSYGFFLLTMKDAPGRDRFPLPLLLLGWLGVAITWAIAILLLVAANKMSKGYRLGYWLGLIGQIALIASSLMVAYTMNWLRPVEKDRALIWLVIGGLVFSFWQVWQLWQYCRGPICSWFDLAQRVRHPSSPANLFHGRSIRLQQ